MKRIAILIALTLLASACSEPSSESTTADAPTWYGDVLPVAAERCLGCHNDEAPTFSMMRFGDELAARAALIADYTAAGVMPPWKPTAECNSYHGERRLSADEIALFRAWADGGAQEGDASVAVVPEPPKGLARVDISMDMTAPYTPVAGVADDLHCFVLDPNLTETEYMVGFDVRPGERRVVHHALVYLVDAGEADALDAADAGNGYSCFGGPQAPSAMVIAGWVPGMPANTFPAGSAIPLAPGKKIIMQIHYNTLQAGALPDQTGIDLQLSDAPPTKPAQVMSMANQGFVIPPNATHHTDSASVTANANGLIWGVAPHMHLLGQRALIEVERKDGSRTCLVDIPDWDFDWQQFYFLQEPVEVAPGDVVKTSCSWDNPGPTPVTWGDGTGDEMCVSYFYVTAP